MKLLFQDGDLELELLLQSVKSCLKKQIHLFTESKQTSKCVKL
jgi:hypothetical protein